MKTQVKSYSQTSNRDAFPESITDDQIQVESQVTYPDYSSMAQEIQSIANPVSFENLKKFYNI